MRIRTRIIAAAAAALLLPIGLAGCQVVESVVEGATGGDVTIGGPSVPEDFPAEVPLVEGTVINGSSVEKDGVRAWNVTVQVADVSAFDGIRAELEAAGFAAMPGYDMQEREGTITGLFGDEQYSVLVAVTTQEPVGTVANYTVTPGVGG